MKLGKALEYVDELLFKVEKLVVIHVNTTMEAVRLVLEGYFAPFFFTI